ISSRVTHARSACGRPPTSLQAPCWCVRSTSPGASRPDNDSRNRRVAPMEPSMEAESFSPGYHPAFERGEVELHTIEPTVHEQSDLREFVGLVKRHAPLIALVTIATAVAAECVRELDDASLLPDVDRRGEPDGHGDRDGDHFG